VLDTISYDSLDTLIEILKPHIIDPVFYVRPCGTDSLLL
jgi:hypothetical protein